MKEFRPTKTNPRHPRTKTVSLYIFEQRNEQTAVNHAPDGDTSTFAESADTKEPSESIPTMSNDTALSYTDGNIKTAHYCPAASRNMR